MKAIDNAARAREIYTTLMKEIHKFPCIGEREWGNPSGDIQLLDVFEVEKQGKRIWVSGVEWVASGTTEVNRMGILSTLPTNRNETLGQILEINLPLNFSNYFNTRMFEDNGLVEIRNYGKFTIGRKGLKREDFFNYHIKHGYEKEILLDEKNSKYICALKIEQGEIDKEFLAERIVYLTYMIKEFKDYFRRLAKV